MPRLIPPVVPAGSLAQSEQPTIGIDDQVQLRPWKPGDGAALTTAFADPEIQRWHLLRMDSTAEADDWIAATRSGWRSETVATWAIVKHDDTTVLGRVSVYFKGLPHGLGEITNWVLPQARGSRLAARATRALSTWAFGDAGMHRLELLHSTENPASCRVAERAGFTAEDPCAARCCTSTAGTTCTSTAESHMTCGYDLEPAIWDAYRLRRRGLGAGTRPTPSEVS